MTANHTVSSRYAQHSHFNYTLNVFCIVVATPIPPLTWPYHRWSIMVMVMVIGYVNLASDL
jgi:hypothetical protein